MTMTERGTVAEITTRLRELIADVLGVDPETIGNDYQLTDIDGGMADLDSLDVLKLSLSIAEEWGIEGIDGLTDVVKVGDVAEVIARRNA